MISAPSFAAAAAALHIMMCIGHAAAADLTCSSDEMQMTSGLLTSCDDSDGSCETKCNSAACSGSGKLEYEYIIPVGGDLSIDCSATEGARCCLASFFEPLFGSIVNTGVQEIGGPTTCDATDEIMMTEGSLVFCNSTVYGTCFIECSDGCTVTSPNSEMTTMSYFATETPQGQDFEYDCNEEGSFCCVDMSDWAQAGPDTPATPETTPSGTDSDSSAEGITELTCSSDEMQMTTGLLTSCDDSDGFCETKCNSATCSGSGKLEYEYIIPVGGDLSIDCSATDGARCCLNSFFEPLFGSIVNTGVQEIAGPTTCDATDEIMMTEGSLVFCNDTVYDRCFIECSDGCTVTSPNSEMTTMSYFATETPQGQDFEYDCNEEGSFCCVDMSDWAQAGPDTPATPETTPSGTDSDSSAEGITELTCSSDEMQMTTGLLTSCDDSDGSCETKCNSAACSGSGKLEYEYIIPVGGDLSIDCSATEGARCCLNSFFEPLFGSIVNTGVQEIGGPTTCDATDEIMMTEGSLVFCNDTVYDRCFIECSDGCTVTSPNSEMTTMSYFATETPQGQDFEYDCNEEGSFCCVDMSDWAQAGPDTPATPETTPSGTDSAGTAPDAPVSTPSEPATPAVGGGTPPAPAPSGPTSSASLIQSASFALLVAVGYCFVIIL